MFEISLFTNSLYKKHMVILEKKLKNIAKNDVILAHFNNKDEFTLSIAIINNVDTNKKRLKNLIAETIVYCEKEVFLKEKIKLNDISNTCSMALIKALVLFDIKTDIEIAKKVINLNKNIDLHALFCFKMQKLYSAWEELLLVTDKNLFTYANTEVLLEFLKFLVDSIEPTVDEICIVKDNEKFKILHKNKLVKDYCKKQCVYDEVELVTTLISISPKKILINSNIKKMDSYKLLNYIFTDRIIIK